MKKNARAGSRLFFIEFLIVLFFFLIISTVCLRIFTQSHLMTRRAEALSHGQSLAVSAAELLEDTSMEAEELARWFPGAVAETDEITAYYDKEFESCAEAEAFYLFQVTIQREGQEQTAQISFSEISGERIYELTAKQHIMLRKEK